jgi:hypothetical protein
MDRLLDPVARCLTDDVAKRLLEIQTDPETQDRINELAAKANEGLLSSAEQAEYEAFVDAIDVLSILQSKARKALISRIC